MGAISRWRVELPPENNYFDPDTLTDLVLHLNYTAREGGEMLRHAAMAAARHKLPGDGWSFFDMRHDFPDAWELFRRPCQEKRSIRELAIRLRRKYFPFLPHDPKIRIVRIGLLFETAEMAVRTCPETEGCPCPNSRVAGSHIVRFASHDNERERKCDELEFPCFSTVEWPRLYSGLLDVNLRHSRRESEGCDISFRFSETLGEIRRAFLFCKYEVIEECCPTTNEVEFPQRDAKGWHAAETRA